MKFVHRAYKPGETIAAIATAPGEEGLQSFGFPEKNAIDVAGKNLSGPIRSYKSHTAHCGKIRDAAGNVVDEVLVLVMWAPRSYTGETRRIHCHGGSIVTRKS